MKEKKSLNCRPQEPFTKRIVALEKRAVAIEKERSERDKLINVEDYFKKQEDQ